MNHPSVPLNHLVPLLAGILAERVAGGERWCQGIQGPVGSGKSTLSAGLADALGERGIRVATLSLDDLYLSPRSDEPMPPRGPPGSHDTRLGLELLRSFQRGEGAIPLPRFSKEALGGAGGRVADEVAEDPQILLFEGWFVGCAAVGAYLPLWREMDALWVLRAPSRTVIRGWRHEAELERRRRGVGLSSEAVNALVDRMLSALPPEEHGALTPADGDAAADPAALWVPGPELLLDLDARREVIHLHLNGPAAASG